MGKMLPSSGLYYSITCFKISHWDNIHELLEEIGLLLLYFVLTSISVGKYSKSFENQLKFGT